MQGDTGPRAGLNTVETTLDDIRQAFEAGELSSVELVRTYLDRIQALDRGGPGINSIIAINPKAIESAEALDAARAASGPKGLLHGVPVILKDQIDVAGMATTLGSVLFKDYYPDRDAFVVEQLKRAGAVILAKATLGEMGGGDTHGSLFGSTRNPYDLERTVGGSSGGTAAAIAANLGAVGVGQEAFSSIRRPSAWTSIVGMRPTAGLVSRSGVYAGWPGVQASLGPMTRTVADAAALLDVLAGYDPEDPVTAMGVGTQRQPFVSYLDAGSLANARIGVLREPMGAGTEPDSDDFAQVSAVFDRAVVELREAGTAIVDPVTIPQLKELLSKRASGPDAEPAWDVYFGRSARAPFKSREEMLAAPDFELVLNKRMASIGAWNVEAHHEYLVARAQLMFNLMKTMADLELDAIVHKSAEHQPTLIRDAFIPPFVGMRGATHMNTFLVYVPSISVPIGFTAESLPVGMTFVGRPYSDGAMIALAYSYEQATHHRKPPASTP
ncbi:MAG: amidase [Chloroflexi bacterium]|nr:amidase [Chloroflexota bacterium]